MTTNLLSIKQAAKLVNRNPETVRRWVREEKIPASLFGNMWFVKSEDVEKYNGRTD